RPYTRSPRSNISGSFAANPSQTAPTRTAPPDSKSQVYSESPYWKTSLDGVSSSPCPARAVEDRKTATSTASLLFIGFPPSERTVSGRRQERWNTALSRRKIGHQPRPIQIAARHVPYACALPAYCSVTNK